MAIYYDKNGNLLESPDLSAGWVEPREVVHHDAVEAITHKETLEFPGGCLTYTVTDTPEQAAWEEVVSYTYHPHPPNQIDRVEAQAVYTAMMTDTLLEV